MTTDHTIGPNGSAQQRRVPLDGAVNFRDLGGYRSVDGRHVKWRQVYRSDSLAELTASDLETFAGLGVRSVCDLRHASEREQKPSRLPDASQPRVHELGFFPYQGEMLISGIKNGSYSAAEVEARLCEAYGAFPIEQGRHYAQLLEVLVSPMALPALIHCTSGKDRTGFGAAVILMALDVPRETIVEDYTLTNLFRRDLAFMVGTQVDPSVLNALKQAHPSYMSAAFATIDRVWGSDAAFVRDGLGLTAQARQQLRDLLLE